MPQTCIITDNSAQFPQIKYTGHDYLHVMPLPLLTEKTTLTENVAQIRNSREGTPLDSSNLGEKNHLTDHEINQSILSYARNFQNIIFLLSSHCLMPTRNKIEQITSQISLPATVDIIDSQTTGFGLGWLAQICAEQIANGMNTHELKRFIYNQINKIYTLFYFQNLYNLKILGVLEEDQAMVGDLLGIHPLVLLEKGRILPYQKVRSAKHFVDSILDYAREFEQIHFIGFHFGSMISTTEKKNILNRVRATFPKVIIDAQPFNKTLNTILGSYTLGAIFIERS